MFTGLKFVIIDDTPSIRTFLRLSLEGEHVELHEAINAATGLELCKKVNPDIVILDLGLPDADGLDILPDIKKIGQDKDIKVLVLTVRKSKSTIKEAYGKGASAYMTKPFMVDDIIETISSLTSK